MRVGIECITLTIALEDKNSALAKGLRQ